MWAGVRGSGVGPAGPCSSPGRASSSSPSSPSPPASPSTILSIDRSGLLGAKAFPPPSPPTPHPEKERPTPLAQVLYDRIRHTGPIPLSTYMKECLTHPGMGYYTARPDVFGARGDFVTSPEISQMFGELVGIWCLAIYLDLVRHRRPATATSASMRTGTNTRSSTTASQGSTKRMSTGSISSTSSKHNDNDDDSVYQDNDEDHRDHQHRLRLRLVELGPGRGTLMADALRQLPLSFLQNMEIHFVEVSPVLRRAQAEALGCVDIVTDSSVEAGDEAYDIGNPNQYHLSHPGRIITRIHTLPFPFTLTLTFTLRTSPRPHAPFLGTSPGHHPCHVASRSEPSPQ